MDSMQKKLVGVGVVALVLIGSVAWMTFRPAPPVAPESTVRERGKSVKPGTESVDDPYYQRELRSFNESEHERAMRLGRSSVPLMNPAPVASQPIQEGGVQQGGATGPVLNEELTKAKLGWMLSYMREQAGGPMQVSSIQGPVFDDAASVEVASAEVPRQIAGSSAVPAVVDEPLVAGGTLAPARLEAALDTDVPVEAFAEIVDGPFAGAKLDGKIQRVGDYIRLSFTDMHLDGRSYKVNAVGLDPDTSRAVLAGEVDNRWMERFGWPFLIELVRGAAQVAAQPNTSIRVSGDTTVTQTDTADQSRQILGGAVAAGTGSIATGMAAEGRVEKRVRWDVERPIVIRFMTEVRDSR